MKRDQEFVTGNAFFINGFIHQIHQGFFGESF